MPESNRPAAIVAVGILPPVLMWIGRAWPWRRHIGRDLSEIECRIWGLAGIIACVIGANVAVPEQRNSPRSWITVVWFVVATATAGIATITMWFLSDFNAQTRWLDHQRMANDDTGPDLELFNR